MMLDHGTYIVVQCGYMWIMLFAYTSKNGCEKEVTQSEEAAEEKLGHPLHPLLYP